MYDEARELRSNSVAFGALTGKSRRNSHFMEYLGVQDLLPEHDKYVPHFAVYEAKFRMHSMYLISSVTLCA